MYRDDDHDPSFGSTAELPQCVEPVTQWVAEIQDERGMRRVELTAKPVVFGSSRTADVLVNDAATSARHCELAVIGDLVRVTDLGSRNGTYMSGVKVGVAYAIPGEIIHVGRSSIALKSTAIASDEDMGEPLPGVIGGSYAMRRVAQYVRKFARYTVPVLILGESGSGKELIARAIHVESRRKPDAFVAVNVAGVPRELMETEMFGHERGAFTGAYQRHRGAFGEADGGTLFLDEIGDLPSEAQPKLLRALDGYEVKAVGQEGRGRKFDVRVVAATNVKLAEKVVEGSFRQDLYHRLEAIVVRLPPLRARRGDLVQLVPALLLAMKLPQGAPEVSTEAMSLLTTHDWPGNVRELKNVLARAVVESDGETIDASAVRRALHHDLEEESVPSRQMSSNGARTLLDRHGGNISRAARAAGMARTSYKRLLDAEGAGALPDSGSSTQRTPSR
jgi:DNA-binding NtrC family response regulator